MLLSRFFVLAYLVNKYSLLFTTRQLYEMNGALWPAVSNQMIAALVIYQVCSLTAAFQSSVTPHLQLTMIGVLGLQQFYAFPALFILPLLTLYFRQYLERRFRQPTKFIPLEKIRSRQTDRDSSNRFMCVPTSKVATTTHSKSLTPRNAYMQPEMQLDELVHSTSLEDVADETKGLL